MNRLNSLPISRDAKVKAEDVDSFIDAQRKQSTKAATARAIKMYSDGCGKIREKSLENILPVWLDAYLAEMFLA